MKKLKPMMNLSMIPFCIGMLFCIDVHAADANQQPDTESSESWTFCSIPDFLNFDIEYPQKG